LAVPAKKTLGGNAERKGQGPGRAGARPLQGGKRNTPSREKGKR